MAGVPALSRPRRGRGARPGAVRPLGAEDTLALLEASVVHREGDLLALSKPPGLPVRGATGEPSLATLLPTLSRRLGLPPELHMVKAPPRECSGLVLLSGCRRAAERLQRFFSESRRSGGFPVTYRAVTVGVPAEPQGEVCTGLQREQRGGTVAVVPVAAPSRRSLARKEVRRTVTRYRVLGAAGGCALLQLQPRTAFPGQLLAHLTLLLCPALGDHERSVPVGRVLGQPFLLPAEAARPPEQVLDEELERRLRLEPGPRRRRLPLHLHLEQLALPAAVLTAPPPPFFLRTLRLLGLPHGPPAPPPH
ncbi:mitochondrial mRNA pseudouridine synthase RPUSD3 [Nothoprocta perdicaria]|uniref:mitochondrial mRNA pseudouridine synthase RPUSD3 n=1 Tax=Nothoprocta perdicaria TaxID=30464 RepID=UPI000E1C0147|nr:mitochondrial mRNA pseudouridine synthase RPUSD3 [Nothoprocta perdicaria]